MEVLLEVRAPRARPKKERDAPAIRLAAIWYVGRYAHHIRGSRRRDQGSPVPHEEDGSHTNPPTTSDGEERQGQEREESREGALA